MSMPRLSIPQFIDVSGRLTGPDRPTAEKYPMLAALLPKLDTVHQNLLALGGVVTVDDRVGRLLEEIRLRDARHDSLVRATYRLFDAMDAYLHSRPTVDETLAARYQNLRAALLPQGLGTTRLNYQAEAGTGQQVEAVLQKDPEAKALLATLTLTGGVTALTLVQDLVREAGEIGRLEGERMKLGGPVADPAFTQRFLRARNDWMSVVNTFWRVVDLSDVSPEDRKTLRRPYEEALAKLPKLPTREKPPKGNPG